MRVFFERIQRGAQNYAPLFLPDRKEKLALTIVETAPNVARDGEAEGEAVPFGPGSSAPLVPIQALVSETADASRAKLNALVIGRQVVYGITVGVTAVAVLAGFRADVAASGAADGKVEILGCTFHFNVDQVDYFIRAVVPEVAHRLVDAAILYPERALAYLAIVISGWLVSRKVRLKMVSISRGAYDKALAELSLNPPGSPTAD